MPRATDRAGSVYKASCSPTLRVTAGQNRFHRARASAKHWGEERTFPLCQAGKGWNICVLDVRLAMAVKTIRTQPTARSMMRGHQLWCGELQSPDFGGWRCVNASAFAPGVVVLRFSLMITLVRPESTFHHTTASCGLRVALLKPTNARPKVCPHTTQHKGNEGIRKSGPIARKTGKARRRPSIDSFSGFYTHVSHFIC